MKKIVCIVYVDMDNALADFISGGLEGSEHVKRIAIAGALAALSISSAYADSAFGIEYGGEVPIGAEEYAEKPGYFYLSSPPKPHSLFVHYGLIYTAETGVCFIFTSSETFENDKYGTKGKGAYDKLVKSLDKKYGPNGDKLEGLKADALWDQADEFAMSLFKGDRNQSRWFEPSADSKTEFDYVEVSLTAENNSETYVILNYRNIALMEECQALLSTSDDDSL